MKLFSFIVTETVHERNDCYMQFNIKLNNFDISDYLSADMM